MSYSAVNVSFGRLNVEQYSIFLENVLATQTFLFAM